MRVVNASFTKLEDGRTGAFASKTRVRGVRTPYGVFRSVAVARDVIMTEHPKFYWDLIGSRLSREEIARRVYYRIYALCKSPYCGPWRFDD